MKGAPPPPPQQFKRNTRVKPPNPPAVKFSPPTLNNINEQQMSLDTEPPTSSIQQGQQIQKSFASNRANYEFNQIQSTSNQQAQRQKSTKTQEKQIQKEFSQENFVTDARSQCIENNFISRERDDKSDDMAQQTFMNSNIIQSNTQTVKQINNESAKENLQSQQPEEEKVIVRVPLPNKNKMPNPPNGGMKRSVPPPSLKNKSIQSIRNDPPVTSSNADLQGQNSELKQEVVTSKNAKLDNESDIKAEQKVEILKQQKNQQLPTQKQKPVHQAPKAVLPPTKASGVNKGIPPSIKKPSPPSMIKATKKAEQSIPSTQSDDKYAKEVQKSVIQQGKSKQQHDKQEAQNSVQSMNINPMHRNPNPHPLAQTPTLSSQPQKPTESQPQQHPQHSNSSSSSPHPSSTPSSTEYNQLQQKLKRLQLMRSRIDQSSQQDYSVQDNQEDNYYDNNQQQNNLYENNQQQDNLNNQQQYSNHHSNHFNNIRIHQQQYQGSLQQQNQCKDDGNNNDYENENNTNNENENNRNNENNDDKDNEQQYIIGETNYQQMEIKDVNQQLQQQLQRSNFKEKSPKQQTQTLKETDSIHEENNFHPTTQTVYQSNVATQQTQHKYLPDQISNSALLDNGSQQKNTIHNYNNNNNYDYPLGSMSNNNSVQHVNQHHSQMKILIQNNNQNKKANRDLIKQDSINIQQDKNKIQQKSDGQLFVVKYQQEQQGNNHNNLNNVNQRNVYNIPHNIAHHIKHHPKDQSLQMLHSSTTKHQQSLSSNKQNQISTSQLPHNQQNLNNYDSRMSKFKSNGQKSIQQLLKQFKEKRSENNRKLQNLKIMEQKNNSQEFRKKQQILKLLEQVNHKSLMILRHTQVRGDKGDGNEHQEGVQRRGGNNQNEQRNRVDRQNSGRMDRNDRVDRNQQINGEDDLEEIRRDNQTNRDEYIKGNIQMNVGYGFEMSENLERNEFKQQSLGRVIKITNDLLKDQQEL